MEVAYWLVGMYRPLFELMVCCMRRNSCISAGLWVREKGEIGAFSSRMSRKTHLGSSFSRSSIPKYWLNFRMNFCRSWNSETTTIFRSKTLANYHVVVHLLMIRQNLRETLEKLGVVLKPDVPDLHPQIFPLQTQNNHIWPTLP